MFKEFESKGINYAIIRDYEQLPGIIGNDLDFMVDLFKINEVTQILKIISDSLNLLFIVIKISHSTLKVTISEKNNITKKITLHFTSYLSNSNTKLSKWNYFNPNQLIYFLSDFKTQKTKQNGLEFIILVEEYEHFIHSLRSRKGNNKNLKLTEFEKKLNTANKKLKEIKIQSTIAKKIRLIKSRILYRQKIKPDLICFSGPDGAGKTTSLNKLIGFFEYHEIKYVYAKHLHFLSWSVYSKFVRDSEKKQKTNLRKKRDRDTGKLFYRLRRWLGVTYRSVDTIVFGRLFIYFNLMKGRSIIIETSPYDGWVKKHRPKFQITETLISRFYPHPDKIFLLKASPEIILNRKPELFNSEIVEYYNRIERALCSLQFKSKVYIIDSNESIKKTSQLINEKITHGFQK